MRACKPLPYGQLTTALVPTVPSPKLSRNMSMTSYNVFDHVLG